MIFQPTTKRTGGWQRPTDWLPIDNLVSAGDDKIVGLYAIFPNESAEAISGNTLRILGLVPTTIDWGDGNVTNTTGGGWIAEHVYDCDDLAANTETTEGFRQAIVTITPTSGNMSGYVNIGAQIADPKKANNFLDIKISSAYVTKLTLGTEDHWFGTLRLCKFVWIGTTYDGLELVGFRYAPIHIFQINWLKLNPLYCVLYYGASIDDLGDITTNATTFNYLASCSYVRRIGNVVAASATNADNMFADTLAEQIGDINIRSATSANSMLGFAAHFLRKIGTINLTACTQMQYMLYCSALTGSINLITSSALADCTGAFGGCTHVSEIILSDASGITVTDQMFSMDCPLASVRLPGIKTSFSIEACSMGTSALDTLFGDLADLTGLTTQTITISGNPGAATCDQTIATAKNWTVVS